MSKVNNAERLYDERIANAKLQAAEILSSAEDEAKNIISDGNKKAAETAKAIIADAEKKAAEIIANAEKAAMAKAEELKKNSLNKESSAVLAVTKKLLELS